MANKRVLMKIDDGEWQFWADIVWLNCLVVFFSMGVIQVRIDLLLRLRGCWLLKVKKHWRGGGGVSFLTMVAQSRDYFI